MMGKLSVAQMQLVEIAEAVSRKADLIIMDEPTSALTEKEVGHLFSIIKDLKQRGVAVIYITHKMDEVFAITDEVSVYRDGELVGHEDTSTLTREKLIKMMVGRTIDQFFQKERCAVRHARPWRSRGFPVRVYFTTSAFPFARERSSELPA